MMKSLLILLLALPVAGFAEKSKPLPVTPRTAYRLSFEAEGGSAGARWAVHLRDAEGNLPFDGVLEGEWQQLNPEKKTYTHLFYAPADAAALELVTQGTGIRVRNVNLEKWEQENLLLNGDFSEGLGNYSGWTERYNAELVEADGRVILRVNLNGYALTDYTPVVGGGRYQIKGEQGRPGYSLLIFDRFRHMISMIEELHGGPFEVPANAAYLRVLYATHRAENPDSRMNEIAQAELKELEAPEGTPAQIERNTEWEIVLAPGSDPREEHAARELQHWITEITGKAPALLAEAGKGKTPRIFVGRAWADSFTEDLKKLEGSEGFAVRKKDGNIHVFGAHPRGSLYGVYALLERNSDIIWPRPNPEFEALFSKSGSLSFSDADFLSRPVFSERDIGANAYGRYIQRRAVFQEWLVRNGMNTPWSLEGGFNYPAWLRGSKPGYGNSYRAWAMGFLGDTKEDDKILPLVDGKRTLGQPCYTYQGTVDGIVAHIKAAMKTLPGRDIEYMSCVIHDTWTVCGCPDCLSPITLPDGTQLTTDTADATKNPVFFSTRNFMMLNKVAEALEKDYPNLRIQTHAYIFTAEPPKVKVHPMIIPEFAAYPTQNLRYPILAGQAKVIGNNYTKDLWKRLFEQWGKEKKGELGYFGYYHAEGFNAVADSAAEDFRALAKFEAVQGHSDIVSFDGEDLSDWDAEGIEKWVMARLIWDPSQDTEALRKHYISRVYRGAEKEMTEFYKLIRDAWHNAPESTFVNYHTGAAEIFQEFIIKPGIEEKAKQLLGSAVKAASDPRSKAMIQRTLAQFKKLGDTVGRVVVPYVEESKEDLQELSSPHWEKAVTVRDFQKVYDWRLFDKKPSEYPTTVKFMHDRKNLYVRFHGEDKNISAQVKPDLPAGDVFPNGDRFELRLKNSKNKIFYFALGPGGHYFSLPSQGTSWQTVVSRDGEGWTGIMTIPLDLLEMEEGHSTMLARMGRMVRLSGDEREESSQNGVSIYHKVDSPTWSKIQIE